MSIFFIFLSTDLNIYVHLFIFFLSRYLVPFTCRVSHKRRPIAEIFKFDIFDYFTFPVIAEYTRKIFNFENERLYWETLYMESWSLLKICNLRSYGIFYWNMKILGHEQCNFVYFGTRLIINMLKICNLRQFFLKYVFKNFGHEQCFLVLD